MGNQSTCRHLHTNDSRPGIATFKGLQTLNSYDPTHTTTLRNLFVREMNKRFNRLKKQIRLAIIEQDCFGLSDKQTVAITSHALPGSKSFQFLTDPDKVDSFMEWLCDETDNIVREKSGRLFGRALYPEEWTSTFVESAYQKGIQRGRAEMLKAKYDVPKLPDSAAIKMAFNSPTHSARAGLLFSRVYRDLEGITQAMEGQISKVLAQGMIDGKSPRELARLLNKTISGTGGTLEMKDTLGRFIPAQRRAQTLARTEIIRAHHIATIQEYESWGAQGVKVLAEFQTAGDDRVCPECGALQGQIFSMKEIELMIPVHPNCRCCALPVDADDVEEKKKGKEPEETVDPYKGMSDRELAMADIKLRKEATAAGIKVENSPEYQRVVAEQKARADVEKEIRKAKEAKAKIAAAKIEAESKIKARIPYTNATSVTDAEIQFRQKMGIHQIKGFDGGNDVQYALINKAGNSIGNDCLNAHPTLRDKMETVYRTKYGDVRNNLSVLNIDPVGKGYPGMKPTVGGFYDPNVHSITVTPYGMQRTTDSLQIGTLPGVSRATHNVGFDFGTIIRHEYGHHVRASLVDEGMLEAIYKQVGKATIAKEISIYASTSSEEMFAEVFAAYTSPLYGKGGQRTLPEWAEMLMKIIVGGRV